MSTRLFLSILCLSTIGWLPGRAQNLIPNGGFLNTFSNDDLWDGVDGDGTLAGTVRTLTGLNDANRVTEVAIPPGVSAGDLNGDGLPDLATADTLGYFRVYFNSGTKEQPKFTHAELVPVYLSRPIPAPGTEREWVLAAGPETFTRGPRLDLYDMGGRGALDIVAGMYGGDMDLIPNSGSRIAPAFRQPTNPAAYLFPTSSESRRWANLLAPAVVDWNKDGKPDLLVGDGSYSANSIFLLLNQGSGQQPKFNEAGRSYLVYGNGRTQLSPTVADYNGDGLPDVIVADRTGRVTVNLNEAGAKPGVPLEKSSVITFGGNDSLRTGATVKAADLNGDGLFDLVFGKANGRLAAAFNKGTKEQPQFGTVADLKGEDVYKRDGKTPSSWTFDLGIGRGNYLVKMNVVNAASDPASVPPSGKNCLRLSYDLPLNKVIPFSVPGSRPGNPKEAFYYSGYFHELTEVGLANATLPPTSIMLKVELNRLEPATPYVFSFSCKGRGFSGDYTLAYHGRGALTEAKITRGERGSADVKYNAANDNVFESGPISPSQEWATVTKSVTFTFKARELNDPKNWKGVGKPKYSGALYLRVDLSPFEGVCYLDNFQLIPKPVTR